MPRDGSNIYSQPFPDVVEDTTIESAVYNGFTNDVSADLNAARPIVAGGTGATSADQALFNLAAEKATQVVTNYDSHLWVPGSFRSAAGATGAPTVNAFAGTAIIGEALANPPTNQNVVLEARDLGDASVPGLKYIREKTAGVWSAWALDVGSQAIRYDADQNLTEAQKAQGRKNIYAAPFDALAYSGMQINGSMQVRQELGAATRSTDGYICDGWLSQKLGPVAFNAGTNDDGTVAGLTSYAFIVITTAVVSPAATDFMMMLHPIEGYRISRLGWGTSGAQPLTIGFWSSHVRTGLYSGAIRNGAFNRSYAFTYTHSVSNVWQFNTVTIPGDTTGTWPVTNAVSVWLNFAMAAGSTYTAPSVNTWTAGNYLAAPGHVNGIAATTDAIRITGVVILPGIEAPSAARSPLIMRPYGEELITCKRYYNRLGGNATSIIVQGYTTAGGGISAVLIPLPMRATPAVSESAAFNRSNVSAVAFQPDGSVTSVQVTATATGGVAWYNAAGQYLVFDARL